MRKRTIWVCISLALLLGLMVAMIAWAGPIGNEGGSEENVAAYVTDKDGNRMPLFATDPGVADLRHVRTPSELEALYPPSDEASIEHPVPNYPLVIDGVYYDPGDISRFNGLVLRFVWDDETAREGVLYAFTTVEGLETYLREQWDWPTLQSFESSENTDTSQWSQFLNTGGTVV